MNHLLEQLADITYRKLCEHHMSCIACSDARGDADYMCPAGARIFRRWVSAEYRAAQAASREVEAW